MKTVLVVDDSAFMRMLLKEKLEKIGGVRVYEAANGGEAVKEYERLNPDLVLLDLVLPDISGEAVLAAIRETPSDTKVIMVTAVGQRLVMRRCEKLGISGYIIKPFDDAELREAITQVL